MPVNGLFVAQVLEHVARDAALIGLGSSQVYMWAAGHIVTCLDVCVIIVNYILLIYGSNADFPATRALDIRDFAMAFFGGRQTVKDSTLNSLSVSRFQANQ